MTPEHVKYFDEMEFLFGQAGWKSLMEDIQLRQNQEKDDVVNTKMTSADLTRMSGRNEVYTYLLSLEATLAEVKRQLMETNE